MPLGLAFFLASWQLVAADFSSFASFYNSSALNQSIPGFLVEYFSVSSVPQQAFADISCAPCASCGANCPNMCQSCPGLAAFESNYASDVLGSLPSRSWVRMTATVAPSIEFKTPVIEPTTTTGIGPHNVSAEEWFGYYFPRSENVFLPYSAFPPPNQRSNWGIRVSGQVLLYSNVATRLRVQVQGRCYSYSLRVGNSSLFKYSNGDASNSDVRNEYVMPAGDLAQNFLFEIRFNCAASSPGTLGTVQGFNVRWIHERWSGPSRVFLLNEPLAGSSGLAIFDQKCQLAGSVSPTLGTWKALLWANSTQRTQRFPDSQLMFPLIHRSQNTMFALGTLNTTLNSNLLVANDLLGVQQGLLQDAIWIATDDGVNCGGWTAATTGNATSVANASVINWRSGSPTSCSEKHMFYCVEVFPLVPAACSNVCLPDVVPCPGVCKVDQPCRTDSDCETVNCVSGMCRGLIPGAMYCKSLSTCTFGPTPIPCPAGFRCEALGCVKGGPYWNVSAGTSCDTGASYQQAFLYHNSSQAPPINPCPRFYNVSYSSNGTYCAFNAASPGCCVGSNNISAPRTVYRPSHAIVGVRTEVNCATLSTCLDFCASTYGECGSVSWNGSGTWFVSPSRVLAYNGSVAGGAWVVLPGGEQFVPLSSMHTQNALPIHNISDEAVKNTLSFLGSAGNNSRPAFLPSAGAATAFFCLTTGVQCWNTNQSRMVEPGESATMFAFLLPMWNLGMSGLSVFLNISRELIHLDLSLNPLLQVYTNQPSQVMGSIELLGVAPSAAACYWTSAVLPTRLAIPDDWCIWNSFANQNFANLRHFVVHQRASNRDLLNLPSSLQSLVVLNGNFPGQSGGQSFNFSLQSRANLTNVIVVNSNFSVNSINASSLKRVGLHNITAQVLNEYRTQSFFSSLANLESLQITNPGIPNLTFTDNFPALTELVVQGKLTDFVMAANSCPQLAKFVVNLGRDTTTPVSDFLANVSCCGNCPALQNVDFSNNRLMGALPGGTFNMSKLRTLNLAFNYLNPSRPVRNFLLDNSSVLDSYLQGWRMIQDWQPSATTAVQINANPLLSGYPPVNLQCASGNCPDTAFCTPGVSSSCTSFWIIDYWLASPNVYPTPPENENHPYFPAASFQLNMLIYGNITGYFSGTTTPLFARPNTLYSTVQASTTKLGCQLQTGDNVPKQMMYAMPTNLPNLFIGYCIFDTTGKFASQPTAGAFTVSTNMTDLSLEPGLSYQETGSWQFYGLNTACGPGTCSKEPLCPVCAAGRYGAGETCDGAGNCTLCEVGYMSGPGEDVCTPCAAGSEPSCNGNTCQCQLCSPGKSSVDKSTCQDCEQGKFSSAFGATSCLQCQQGQSSELPGASACSDCEPGKFSQSGYSSCVECPSAKFSGVPGATTCDSCPNGQEASSVFLHTGSSACEDCAPGKYRNGTSQSCADCGSGEFQPAKGQSNCIACAVGKFNDLLTQIACTACPAGKFSNKNGSSICTSCTGGKAQMQTGQSACTNCTGGKSSARGPNSCENCGPGYFSGDGAPQCTACEVGKFTPKWNATVCTNCPFGTLASKVGQMSCNNCTAGRYSDVEGVSVCELCQSGTYQNFTGQTSCIACPAGFDSRAPGSPGCTACLPGRAGLNCTQCPEGKFQPEPGSMDCILCELGKFTDPPQNEVGATSCQDCAIGKYGSNVSRARDACVDCPAHSSSDAGADSITNCTCVAGYYGSSNESMGTGPTCTACPGCAKCAGGASLKSPAGCYLLTPAEAFVSSNGQQNAYAAIPCSPPESCLANSVCAPEYTGELCHYCQTDHYRVGGKCTQCPSLAGAFWVLMILLLFVITLALLRLSRPSLSKINSVGIFLSGVQIISVFGYIPVAYPDTAKNMFQILSVANFNLDLFSAECSTRMRFYGLWLFKLGLPLFFLGSLGVIYLLVRFIPRCRTVFNKLMGEGGSQQIARMARDVDESTTDTADWSNRNAEEMCAKEYAPTENDRFVYCIVSLMSLLYTFLATTASQPFQCTTVGFRSVLLRDPSELCYTDEWKGYATIGGLAMIVYTAGFPAILFYFLFRGHSQNKLSELDFLARYGSLVIPYRSQFFYWTILDMLRKAGVVLCLSFLPGSTRADITLQINLIFLLTFAFLLAQVMTNPFEYNFCNRLCFVWLTATLLTLVSALLFHSPGLAEGDRLAYAVFLLIIVIFAIVVTIYVAIREIRRAHWRATMEKRTGVTTLTRRKYQRALLGDIFEGFSHDVWRKMRIYNDEESLKFFHYLARNVRQDGRIQSKPKNLLSDDDLKESDRVAQQGAIELVRIGPDL